MEHPIEDIENDTISLDVIGFAQEHFSELDDTDKQFFSMYKKRLQIIFNVGVQELKLEPGYMGVRTAMQMYFIVKQEVENDIFSLSFLDVLRMGKELYKLHAEYDTEIRNIEFPFLLEENELHEQVEKDQD